MSYPDVITFKDSVVTSTVLGGLMTVFSAIALWMYLDTGENGLPLLIFLVGAVFMTVLALTPTVSTLSPEGVKVKALGGTVFHKWSDLYGLAIYRQTGYMGVGRRYVTFQDPKKRLQKHVFLIPIDIYSKPKDVLAIVDAYRKAALNAGEREV